MKRFMILLLAVASARAEWAPEWDNLQGYDRSKRYIVTADVQRITRTIYWTNPVTSEAMITTQTYDGVVRPDATTGLLATWSWSTSRNETVYLSWSNTFFTLSPVLVRYDSAPALSQEVSVSVADRLLMDIYNALYERAVVAGVMLREGTESAEKREHLADVAKPSLYGAASVVRVTPSESGLQTESWPHPYLQAAKLFVSGLIGSFVDTSKWPTAYLEYPFQTARHWTASALLAAVGGPTNYFDLTPDRDWEGRWTNYGEVVTGTWVMAVPLVYDPFTDEVAPATTNKIFTNYVVDACGNELVIVGTNGQVVAFVCTNSGVATGRTHADYGFKYLKEIISKLKVTEHESGYYSDTTVVKIRAISAAEDQDNPEHGDCAGIWEYARPRWEELAGLGYTERAFSKVFTPEPDFTSYFYSRSCCIWNGDPDIERYYYTAYAYHERRERSGLRHAVGGLRKAATGYTPKTALVFFGSVSNDPGFGACDDQRFVAGGGPTSIATNPVHWEAEALSGFVTPTNENDYTVALVADYPVLATPELCDPPLDDPEWWPPNSELIDDCIVRWGASGNSYLRPYVVLDWGAPGGCHYR